MTDIVKEQTGSRVSQEFVEPLQEVGLLGVVNEEAFDPCVLRSRSNRARITDWASSECY
jgi:predicted xylose isomerase-like sugar epimerase